MQNERVIGFTALELEFSASEFVMSQNKSTKLDSTAENMTDWRLNVLNLQLVLIANSKITEHILYISQSYQFITGLFALQA